MLQPLRPQASVASFGRPCEKSMTMDSELEKLWNLKSNQDASRRFGQVLTQAPAKPSHLHISPNGHFLVLYLLNITYSTYPIKPKNGCVAGKTNPRTVSNAYGTGDVPEDVTRYGDCTCPRVAGVASDSSEKQSNSSNRQTSHGVGSYSRSVFSFLGLFLVAYPFPVPSSPRYWSGVVTIKFVRRTRRIQGCHVRQILGRAGSGMVPPTNVERGWAENLS